MIELGFKGYVSLQKTLNVIALVIFEIFGTLLLILSIALMVALDEIGDSINELYVELGAALGGEAIQVISMIKDVMSMGPAILLAIVIVAIVAVTAYIVLLNRSLKKIINYVNHMSTAIEYSAYKNQEEPPYISLFIFGGLNVISGILLSSSRTFTSRPRDITHLSMQRQLSSRISLVKPTST